MQSQETWVKYELQYFRCYCWNIENMKYLGVTFVNKLKFDKHINNKINTAYQMLGIGPLLKWNFIYLTPDSFVVLYKAMIRSHLEYTVSVWNRHHQFLIEQELSYRKQNARQLRTQYVEGIHILRRDLEI